MWYFRSFMQDELIAEYLRKGSWKKAVITTHHKPDSDALGSSLGLYHFLKAHVAEVQVITPTDYPDFLYWMPGNDHVMIYEGNEAACNNIVHDSDVVFCLDFNTLSRINELGEVVRAARAVKVLIDHHQEPEGFEDLAIWTTATSSTCELVYGFISRQFGKESVSIESAACLYSGILTDTGNFRHNNTRAETHRTVADLIELGANIAHIHEQLYDNFREERLRLIGYTLAERMEILEDCRTALITLSKEDLERFQVQTGDTEGLVNYGLSIQGIRLAVLIIDRSKLVKMSFRSKGGFSVNDFARKHFQGGGHYNAAGGQSSETFEAAVARFKEVIRYYRDELNEL
jgi:phosphoesterase RecJ-like protein